MLGGLTELNPLDIRDSELFLKMLIEKHHWNGQSGRNGRRHRSSQSTALQEILRKGKDFLIVFFFLNKEFIFLVQTKV